MELKIEHIAAYLPYKLEMLFEKSGSRGTLKGVCMIGKDIFVELESWNIWKDLSLFNYKPLLRPLSSLAKPITHDGETFVPLHRFYGLSHGEQLLIDLPEWGKELVEMISSGHPFQLTQFQKLHSWHFDLYHLLDNNLALNIEEYEQ